MQDDINLGAVPAAESPGYGDAVTDEEFEEWVKRSQADTDAAIADWDNSVHFDQIRSMVPPPLEVDDEVIEAEILNEDGTVATAEEVNESRRVAWQSMADRIRAGEDIGPDARAAVLGEEARAVLARMPSNPNGPSRFEQWFSRMVGPAIEVEFVNVQCDDPACECHTRPPAPIAPPPEFARMLRDEYLRMREAAFARRNLETMGFVVVDDAAGPRASGLVLPSDDAVAWAKREFGVIPPAEIAPGFTWTRG